MVSRVEASFSCDGDRCAAWVFRSQGPEPAPCVVLAHGFAATREERLPAYAERFAAAGITAVAFDYRHFGASEGEPRQLLDIGRQLDDWAAAIAFARTLDGVDPERVALWGSSFAGGHVLEAAARDGRVAAVVSQSPFVDGPATLRAIGPRDGLRLTVAGLCDQLGALAGRAPHRIPSVGPPGTLGFLTTPDAEAGMASIVPPGSPWRNAVAARVALRIALYRPGRRAAQLDCPLLVCVCEEDRITPPAPAVRVAERAPRGELRRYPIGHFDIYTGDDFERAVGDQTEFLVRNLAARAAGDARAH